MKKWQLISLLVVVYIVGLIVLLPARLVVAIAPMPNDIMLGRVDGTIWQGSIERIGLPLEQDTVVLHNLNWKLSPLALLKLTAAVDINIPADQRNLLQGELQLYASRTSLRLKNVRMAGQLEDFLPYAPVTNPVPLRAGVSLNIAEYQLGAPACERLNGRVLAMQTEAQLGNSWQALGDYETALGCDEGRISISMPSDNPLGLSVQGHVSSQGIDLRIGVAPTAAAPQGIRDLMEWLGPADSQGRRYFNFRL